MALSAMTGAPVAYYHGGRGGLTAGSTILPPAATGYLRPQRMLRAAGWANPMMRRESTPDAAGHMVRGTGRQAVLR